MDILDIFQRLTVALAAGLLIGIERGWREREDPEGSRTAGIRTFTLSGFLGGLWGLLAKTTGENGIIAFAIAFASFGAIIFIFRFREALDDEDFGVTTVIAALITFALGAYAVIGEIAVAAAGSVVTAGLLAAKGALHQWIRKLTWEELRSGIVLLAMTVILIPILPNKTVGPYNLINPLELWLMTVLIAVVSFAGYVAIKLAGERAGIILSGIAGGMTSSTAVTVHMARLAKQHPDRQNLFISGAALAGGTMMLRVLTVAAVFNFELLRWLLPSLLPAGIAMAALGLILLSTQARQNSINHDITYKNPFDLTAVLQFGALLAIILIVSKLLSTLVGPNALYLFSAVSGIGDVDAITLSMTRLGKGALSNETAAFAILIAVAANTFSKVGIAGFAGGNSTGFKLFVVSAIALLIGYAGLLYGQSVEFGEFFKTLTEQKAG